jgi:hypothetical protein
MFPASRERIRRGPWGCAALALLAGCGGGGSDLASSSSTSGGTTGAGTDTVPVVVDSGPAGVTAVNTLYTTVTVCAPGSTTECQTIDHIQVDTASSGFRVIASVLGKGLAVSQLTAVAASNGNALVECTVFADGYSWGTVKLADVTVGGEKASSVPIQVIGDPAYPDSLVPNNCQSASVDNEEDTVAVFGANGLIGLQGFQQDCGAGCAPGGDSSTLDGSYYNACSTSACVGTYVALDQQVENPDYLFTTDNNGVVIQLPAETADEATATGTLIFGIGTESNNALAAGTNIYTLDENSGTFITSFGGNTALEGITDTGSSSYFFPAGNESAVLPTCKDIASLYCPTVTQSLSGTIQGDNGTVTSVAFKIENGDTINADIISNSIAVAPYLGAGAGQLTTTFDWGLSFFYGRTEYVLNQGFSLNGQSGPLIAF